MDESVTVSSCRVRSIGSDSSGRRLPGVFPNSFLGSTVDTVYASVLVSSDFSLSFFVVVQPLCCCYDAGPQ